MNFEFTNGDTVIDIDQSYNHIEKLEVTKDFSTGELFITSYDYHKKDKLHQPLNSYTGKLIPFYLGIYDGKIPDEYFNLRYRYFELISFIKRYIYGLDKNDAEENQLIKRLCNKAEITEEEAKILLKLLIINGDIQFSYHKRKFYFYPSLEHKDNGDRKRFLSTIIDEILDKSRRINLLINHAGTVGSYRENLLINVLSKYIPNKFSISTGFIEGIPRQIDIIIYDSQNYIPLFRENNLVVVKLESVRVIIEVKSVLNWKELNDALELLHDISQHKQPIIPIFKGIFAFDSNYKTASKLGKAIINFYNKGSQIGYKFNKLDYLFQIIDSVCVPNKFFVFSSHVDDTDEEAKKLRPNLRTVSKKFNLNVEGAYFLTRMFSFLDVENSSRKVNNNYFFGLENEAEIELIGFVHELDWLFKHQILGAKVLSTEDDFKNRHNIIVEWLNGLITTDMLFNQYAKRAT